LLFSGFYRKGNVSTTLTKVSKMKFHENPAVGVAVILADGRADTKKRSVAFRYCFAKASKMGNDGERMNNGEKNAGSLKERTKGVVNEGCEY
jgi:hypothetical protein